MDAHPTAADLDEMLQSELLLRISQHGPSRAKKNDRFILVTSAIHMPRAMGLFANQGLAPIPAPADFLVKRGRLSYDPGMFYPKSGGVVEAESLIRESLGILWAKLRGRM